MRVDENNELGDSACCNTQTHEIFFSRSLIDLFEEREASEQQRRLFVTSVLVHEAQHSAHTHYWVESESPTAHHLANIFEDLRLNRNSAKAVSYFERGLTGATELLQAGREGEKKPPVSDRAHFLDFIDRIYNASFDRDPLNFILHEARETKSPAARELAERVAPSIAGLMTHWPANVLSPAQRCAASARWTVEASRIIDECDDLLKIKQEDKRIKEMRKEQSKTREQIMEKIREKLKQREKDGTSAGGEKEAGQASGCEGEGNGSEKAEAQPGDGGAGGKEQQPSGDAPSASDTGMENDEALDRAVDELLNELGTEGCEALSKILAAGTDRDHGAKQVSQPEAEAKEREHLQETGREQSAGERPTEKPETKETTKAERFSRAGGGTSDGYTVNAAATDTRERTAMQMRRGRLAGQIREARAALATSIYGVGSLRLTSRPDDSAGELDVNEAAVKLENPGTARKIFHETVRGGRGPQPRQVQFSRILISVDGSGSMQRFDQETRDFLHIIHTVCGQERIPVASAVDNDGTVRLVGAGGVLDRDVNEALTRVEGMAFNGGGNDMGPCAIETLAGLHQRNPLADTRRQDARLVILTDCCAMEYNVERAAKAAERINLPTALFSVGPDEATAGAWQKFRAAAPRLSQSVLVHCGDNQFATGCKKLFEWMRDAAAPTALPTIGRVVERQKQTGLER